MAVVDQLPGRVRQGVEIIRLFFIGPGKGVGRVFENDAVDFLQGGVGFNRPGQRNNGVKAFAGDDAVDAGIVDAFFRVELGKMSAGNNKSIKALF